MRSLESFSTAVSLHCHTQHSREMLDFIPHYAARIPVINRLFTAELQRYEDRHGRAVDFRRAWWTPPVTARTVYESEVEQINHRLDKQALVSITDHDDIEAPSLLRVLDLPQPPPVSLEWTVPFGAAYFHLGVHNLPADQAAEFSRGLLEYTADPGGHDLRDLLTALNLLPGTLVVLNHPFWDIECLGQRRHNVALGQFIGAYGKWLHALEVNGFRFWHENEATIELAGELGLPIISGGDRHGCQCNTTLNLTAAASFDEFAAEIRDGHSEVLVLPEYREPMAARMLESAAEILRTYPQNPESQQNWLDRIFIRGEDEEIRALSHFWPHGGPGWVRAAVRVMCLLGSPRFRPALRRALPAEEVLS
ncbi:MAG: PHP domain-containing protein [Blastocatellia bacterium]